MEIDLVMILRSLKRNWWVIVLLPLIGLVLGYAGASLMTPSFQATTSLLVTAPLSDNTVIADTDRAETYVQLVESGPVLERVIGQLDLPFTRQELADMVSPVVVLNTQVIQITVTDTDAKRAADIANVTATSFEQQVTELTIGKLREQADSLNTQTDEYYARLDALDAQIAERDVPENDRNADVQKELTRLNNERLRVTQTIADLEGSIRSINAQIVTSNTPVAVADVAPEPQFPVSPKPLVMAVLGLFVGGVLGVTALLLLGMTDKKLRDATEIDSLTGAQALGTLAEADLAGAFGEQLRVIRAQLAAKLREETRHSLAVLAVSGRHPEQVSERLAALFSSTGMRVTLVATTQSRSGGEPLTADSRFAMLQDGSTQVLRVSPIQANSLPDDFMASPAFHALVEELESQVDLVITEGHTGGDGLSAALGASSVVLVATTGVTDRDELQAMASVLHDRGITVLGTILTR